MLVVGNAVSSAPRSLNPDPLTRVVLFDGRDGAIIQRQICEAVGEPTHVRASQLHILNLGNRITAAPDRVVGRSPSRASAKPEGVIATKTIEVSFMFHQRSVCQLG